MSINQRSKRKKRRTAHNAIQLNLRHKVLAFVLAFAAIGGIAMLFSTKAAIQYVAYPPHRAQCVENNPSKTAVRPGETFTARVRIKNTGTSTFHPDFGVYLEEFRDGSRIWNASGILLSRPAKPGETATFNLSMKAPNKPGTYSFNWGVAVVMNGFLRTPCTGKSVTVMNPPSVSLRANNSNGNISLNRGASLKLNWSASNNPSNCTASGSWSGSKPANGSENRSADMRSTGTKTYRLTCSNAVGSGSATRTVTVNNPPAPAPRPPSRPPSSTPSPATPPASNSSPAPAPRPSSSSNPASTDNTTPSTTSPEPQKPSTLSAIAVGDATVRLTWSKAEGDDDTQGYEIQRSTDKENWETIQEYTTDEVYIDSSVQFETRYYYRVRAIGLDDKKSDYATIEVTTNPFNSNTSNGDLTLESEDKQITVIVPEDAITEAAFCSLRNDNSKPSPEIKNHEVVLGPFEILCKTKSGAVISTFNANPQVSARTDQGSYIALKLYTYRDNWQEATHITVDAQESYPVDTPHFAVLGEKKSSPLIIKILFGAAILAGVIIGSFFLLSLVARYKQQQAIKSKIADYRSKERGY